jgi:hypothetical protein
VPGKPFGGKSVNWDDKEDDDDEETKEQKTAQPTAVDHVHQALADLMGHHEAVHPDHEMKVSAPIPEEKPEEKPEDKPEEKSKGRRRTNGKTGPGGYQAALKDMEATLAKYGQPAEPNATPAWEGKETHERQGTRRRVGRSPSANATHR